MTPRDTARAWLADPLGVVLDFETTAIDGYAIEIAVLDMTELPLLLERFHPGDGVVIDPRAEAVHGIRLDHLASRPTLAERIDEVRRVLSGRHVVAYNADFDARVYQREMRRMTGVSTGALQCEGSPTEWRCAMHLYSEHVGEPGRNGGYKWQKLPGGDHSALGDAKACLEVVRKVAGWSEDDVFDAHGMRDP